MKAFPPLASPLVHLQAPVRRAKRPGIAPTALFLLLMVSAARPCRAQDIPRIQVFGGYSYTRFDSPSFGFANTTGMNGYNFSPAYNFFRGLGLAAEISGQYGSNINLIDAAIGPQFLYPKGKLLFFGHALFGEARSKVQVGKEEEDSEFAVAVGGGMDLNVTSHFALRVFQVDYLHTTFFQTSQNNMRFSTGLVYRWGAIRKKGRRAPAKSP